MTGSDHTMTKRAALYLRVSTGEQTTDNQRRELKVVAKQRGWDIVAVYEDAGVSGAKGRDQRPQFDAMLKDAVRGKYDILAVWSVDRMGRSLQDLVNSLNELHGAGVDLFLHQQAIDTTTPAGMAMFQMLGFFAQFERSMIQERIRAGLARAREQGKTLGRRRVTCDEAAILKSLRGGQSVRKTATRYGVSASKVQRVMAEAV